MSWFKTLRTQWKRLLATPESDNPQMLLDILSAEYCELTQDITRLHHSAQRVHYAQDRERLLQFAAEEQAHVTWLQEKIRILGGELPQKAVTPQVGRNGWDCLRLAVEEKRHHCARLQRRINIAMRLAPDVIQGLQHIRQAEQQRGQALLSMQHGNAPYTLPDSTTSEDQITYQKQDWLGQRKSERLNQRRAEWEANGKPIPWAECLSERENEWRIDLPNREVAWARYVETHKAEQQKHQHTP
jgi:hypothetical protein